jgi:hypothetical protein
MPAAGAGQRAQHDDVSYARTSIPTTTPAAMAKIQKSINRTLRPLALPTKPCCRVSSAYRARFAPTREHVPA